MSIVEQYVLMNEVGGSMPWCDYKKAQEELQKQREIEAKEQERAVAEVTGSQDTLYGILNRSEHCQEVSQNYKQHWKVYRQYFVTDLEADIIDAFDQCKEELANPLEADHGMLRVDVYLADTHDNYNSVISYERIASILSMDFEIEISRPMAKTLARHIQHQTGRTEFPEVEIIFNRM